MISLYLILRIISLWIKFCAALFQKTLQQLYQQTMMMKVKIKSVLKTTHTDVDCFQDEQIIFRSGNTLCIKEIGKNQCHFICLNPQLDHLYGFKPATNRKGVFTAQKSKQLIQIAHYNLKGDRKSIPLSPDNPFFNEVQQILLLVDEFDNSIVYGSARNKQGACVFVADIGKLKVLAYGYMPHFEDIKLDCRQNLTLSICCNNGTTNSVKLLRYTSGQWEIQQRVYKKIQHGLAFQHQTLPCSRMILATKPCIYLFQDAQILQTIELEGGMKIKQILKIGHGLLVFGEDQLIRVFVEDTDEVTYVNKGFLKLELEQGDAIHKVFLSNNSENVIIRTTKNNIYQWKCEHIGLDAGHFDFTFNKVENSCASSHEGSISISTGRKYCMLTGSRNLTLWNIQKNQFVMSSQFITSLEAQKKKSIFCSAINPDGNSFMVAYQDKIRIYKILLTKFKYYAEFGIKKCQNIQYSHGGQLVACKFGKGVNSCITIINVLRMVEIGTLKIQSQPIQIIWNELDDQIIITTETNTVQIYKIADCSKTHTIKFNSKISNVRIDYKLRKIMVSTENLISIIENGSIVEQVVPNIPNFDYIFPLYGIYFLTTTTGVLYWSYSYKFQQNSSFSLFTKSPFRLICRNGFLIAYSSFQNVMILRVQRLNYISNKGSTDEIVMIQRDQILGLFEKVKVLQNNFDILTTATQIKLEQQKNNYEAALNKFKNQYSSQINFVNYNLNQVSTTKLKQEKQTEKIFQELQIGQIKCVNNIQKMYQRKCSIVQQKYLNLEQSNLQQKIKYEEMIKDLQFKYHQEVSQIRKKYEKDYRQQCQRAQKEQNKILQYKQKMEYKLLDLEQQNQITMLDIQQTKQNQIKQLYAINERLESQLRDIKGRFRTISEQKQQLQDKEHQKQLIHRKLKATYEESLNRISMLEKQIQTKNKMIDDKNQFITQLGHQVGGLEKAKYVLGFRTTEIRKELEPKDALVDRLKSQLQKVDEEFKQEKSKNFLANQKIEKFTKINEVLKKQNGQLKLALKLKERIHDGLCSDLFTIVNTIDIKEWSEHIIKIYKLYIKQEKVKSRQSNKKDNTSEQINRHLMHVQQSLQQVASGNQKIMRGKEKDVTRRMKQNSQLLYQLNMMKKKEKEIMIINNDLTFKVDRMEKELDQFKSSKRNSTRSQTAYTGITRRVVASRDALYSREKSMVIDGFDLLKDKDFKEIQKDKSRIASAHKTLMFRDQKRQKSSKFFDIAKQLQTAKNTIKMQDQMIQQLNQRLFGGEDGLN